MLVQTPTSQQWLGDAEIFRTSWNRLCGVRGLERAVVVVTNPLRAATEKKLAKTPLPPVRFVEMTSTGLEDIMKNLVSCGAAGANDVVLFDRCVSPFVSVGTLEACVEAAVPETKLTVPTCVGTVLFRSPGGVSAPMRTPIANTTVGAYRITATTPNVIGVDATRIELLQIDLPEDMTIAQAMTMFGDDK